MFCEISVSYLLAKIEVSNSHYFPLGFPNQFQRNADARNTTKIGKTVKMQTAHISRGGSPTSEQTEITYNDF